MVLRAATRLVTDLLGASPAVGRERISETELRDLVAANTLLDADEHRIIDEVLVAGASLVREVMMPRTEVVPPGPAEPAGGWVLALVGRRVARLTVYRRPPAGAAAGGHGAYGRE